MKKLFTLAFIIVTNIAWAQSSLVNSTAINPNKALELKFKQTYQLNQAKAKELSQKLGIPLRQKLSTGEVAEFYGFSANGQMLFYETHNVGAGRSLSTNKVWPGGTANTALTGSGMTNRLGEWDGGAVLTTHQEFGGRVVQVDGATDVIEHATHVAGTLVAAGVDANAKGMSYQAPLKAYDWNNDESEMAVAAAAGMLVSNHSYGTICGWRWNPDVNSYEWWGDASISQTEDYKFGFYDQQAANWDDIAFNNPFYLICKSAGNDRGGNIVGGTSHLVRDANFDWVTSNTVRLKDGGSLGYDCVTPSAVSKNMLTVGAVNKVGSSNTNNGYVNTSSVVMSSFSGWGPTDDGRIKPDVVGAGVDIYSTGPASNTAYLGGFNGTSMASPNVAGSILLVQQHYQNLKGKFMLAATLKGLIIHTANEAGAAEGPDYQSGWGLVNTFAAVKLITDSNVNQIQERVLNNAGTYTQSVSSDGTTPLKVTICWMDRSGTPVAESLDPTNKMLVNDLDIRLTRNSDNVVLFPYVLNPASPASAATKADNSIDNVEQIYVAAPLAGSYTITVSHKGSLVGSSQKFSLIVGGIVGKPAAAFSSNKTAGCSGDVITYTDNSGGNPTGRIWYFPGGTPSTSTLGSVNVTYANTGNFAVALKVTNALGTDSLYKPSYIKIGGYALPFTETFESTSATLADWEVENPDNDSTWYLANTGGTTPGDVSACIPFYSMNMRGRRDYLYSPTLNFKGFENISLSFKHAKTLYASSEQDSLIVSISTNCGATWTRLRALGENGTDNFNTEPITTAYFIPSVASEWCTTNCNTISLAAYSGLENVKIRFEGYNDYSNNLYLDNIAVTGSLLKPIAKFGTTTSLACVGSPVQFVDSSLNIPSAWVWTFTGATNVISTVQNPSVIYATPGTYTVKLKVTNAGGLDSIIKTNFITVLPSPNKPNINTTASGMCIGDSVTLSTDSISLTYSWTKDNNILIGANSTSFVAHEAGNYSIIGTAANGCSTKSSIQTILTGPKPTTPVVTSNIVGTTFCQGGTATLTSSSTTGNQWYKNNTLVATAINKTFATQDSGFYHVVSTQNGCASNVSNTLTYSLKPKPNTSVISGSAMANNNTLETYSVTPTPGSIYLWTPTGGVVQTGAGTSSVSVKWGPNASATLAVRETGSNGCFGDTKTLSVTLTPSVGLEKIDMLQSVKIFPNPMFQELNIRFDMDYKQPIDLKILNMIGQVVSYETINTIVAGTVHSIDVSKLNAGIYFIELTSADGSKQVKLIKK
jgi:PKD repeat protein